MIPIGKKYLIKCEVDHTPTHEEDGIIVLNDSSVQDIYWKGKIVAYGTMWTEEEKKDLIPIGKTVVFDYSTPVQNKRLKSIKVAVGKDVYYLEDPDEILGVFEDD